MASSAPGRPELPSREFSSATLREGLQQIDFQQCKVEPDSQIREWEEELQVGVMLKNDCFPRLYDILY